MSPPLPAGPPPHYVSATQQMQQNAGQDGRNAALSGGRGKRHVTRRRYVRSHRRRRATKSNLARKGTGVKRKTARKRGILRKSGRSRHFRGKKHTRTRRVRWNSKYKYYGGGNVPSQIPMSVLADSQAQQTAQLLMNVNASRQVS